MMTEEDRTKLRDVVASVYRGETKPMLENMAPGYVTHTPGRSVLAGDFYGEEHVTVHREQFIALSQGSFKVTPIDAIQMTENWALVPVEVTATKDGRELSTTAFGIWRFENGKLAEHWEMNFDQYAFDAFFANAEVNTR